MAWLPRGDRMYCDRHDQDFDPRAMETCVPCLTDPGPPPDEPDDEPLPTPPDGCATSHAHERQFTEVAIYAEQLARDAAAEGNALAAGKLLAEALKARRAAAQLTRAREDDAFVARLDRRRTAMRRGTRH